MRSILLIWFGLFIGAFALLAQESNPGSLSDYAVEVIRDIEARVVVEKADLEQLEKINKDFGIIYRLREVTVRYKEPDKFRLENRLGVFIVNGSTRYIRVPQLGLRRRDDLGAELSRRHSLFDMGVLTTRRLGDFRWTAVGHERLDDQPMAVFEATFRDTDSVRYRLYMDPQRKCVRRRVWLGDSDTLRAVFDYLEPREVMPSVWVPTRVEVRNSSQTLAGVARYLDLKVNQDPPDSIFQLDP